MPDEKPPGEGSEPPKEQPALRSISGGKDRRRAARGRRKAGQHVDNVLYQAMAETYLTGKRTIEELVIDHGVAFRTGKRAIEVGWPEKKWPSLQDRALLYDKQHVDQVNSASPVRAKHAKNWLEMREDYIKISSGIRGALAKTIGKIIQNTDGAVATQVRPVRRVHYEEVLDGKGKVIRRIPRTLTEDVTMAPSIFDVATALNQIASALERTGGGELQQMLAKPPQGSTGRRGHGLTEEQIRWMAENRGAIPPGVTLAQLGDF